MVRLPTTVDPLLPGSSVTVIKGDETVEVVYKGSVPDAYRIGREVIIDGQIRDGVLQATPDTLVAKCPSKYEEQKAGTTSDSA